MKAEILQGDCRTLMATLPERWFHCCVSSPPYWNLRDYGVDGQIGLESSPDAFIEAMVDVYRGVWRVLRDDGVCWLNIGDSYASGKGTCRNPDGGESSLGKHLKLADMHPLNRHNKSDLEVWGLKPKDLCGIPWRVALALQSAGWYLRDAIVWHKPAPMPGSQRDRCTSSYEFIFQLTKQARYFFDLEAIKQPHITGDRPDKWEGRTYGGKGPAEDDGRKNGNLRVYQLNPSGSTPRNVWTMASGGYKDAHFATFPIELPTRCIKASTSANGCCPECGAPWERIVDRQQLKRERPNEYTKRNPKDAARVDMNLMSEATGLHQPGWRMEIGNHCANTVAGVETRTLGWQPTCECGHLEAEPCRVLDCFNGAGTTAVAARRLGVDYIGCELNPDYIEMTHRRLRAEQNRGGDVPKVKPAPGQAELF